MAKFIYKAVTKENKLITGAVSALTRGGAEKQLAREGTTVLFVAREKTFLYADIQLPAFGFSNVERVLFFRNLASMMSVGVSMIRALEVLRHQIRSAGVKKAITQMIADIENGERLSAAMGQFPQYFPPYLIETVHVGEASGELSDILDRISVSLEQSNELRRKVVGAIAYPLVVICVMALVLAAMTTYVLPKIADLYRELQAPLPATTAFLLTVSTFIVRHPFWLLGAAAGVVALIYLVWRKPRGRRAFHLAFLKLPIFGELIKEYNLARLFHSLETLLSSGVSLVQSVDIAKKTLRNEVYRTTLDSVIPLLTHGTPLSETLRPYPFLFPLQAQSIVEVGESTGKLTETFKHITVYYERSIQH